MHFRDNDKKTSNFLSIVFSIEWELLLRDECKRVHKRNLRLDFSITENNDFDLREASVVPSSRRLSRKNKERKDRQCFNNRVYNGTCLVSSSLISLSPMIARSKFLEREREFLYRFYPKKVAKKIDKYLPRSTSIIPPFLQEGTRPSLASYRSLVRMAIITLYRGIARCFT